MALAIALFVTVWARNFVAFVMVMVFTTVTAVLIRAGCVTAREEPNVFFVMVTESAQNAMAQAMWKIHQAVTMTTIGTMTVAAAAHPKSCATIAKGKKTVGTTSILPMTNTIATGVANVSGAEVTAGQEALDSMFRVPIVTHQEKWEKTIQQTHQAMDIVPTVVAVADAVNVEERATNKCMLPYYTCLTN